MITLWSTQNHYDRHLRPIANELTARGVDHLYIPPWEIPQQDPNGVLVVAAYRDLRRQKHWKARVLVEHGVGQTYSNGHHAYSGGAQREPYDLLLAPSVHVEDQAARSIVPVGCLPGEAIRRQPQRLVALLFHWPCHVAQEAGTAFETFAPVLRDVALNVWRLNHHIVCLPHPRWGDSIDRRIEEMGIPVVHDLDRVLQLAACVAADNTSAMFEAAWLDIPIVVMNDPTWRTEHGKRFGEWADVGHQVDDPQMLPAAVELALCCDPLQKNRRWVADQAYATVQSPRRTATDAILRLV